LLGKTLSWAPGMGPAVSGFRTGGPVGAATAVTSVPNWGVFSLGVKVIDQLITFCGGGGGASLRESTAQRLPLHRLMSSRVRPLKAFRPPESSPEKERVSGGMGVERPRSPKGSPSGRNSEV